MARKFRSWKREADNAWIAEADFIVSPFPFSFPVAFPGKDSTSKDRDHVYPFLANPILKIQRPRHNAKDWQP